MTFATPYHAFVALAEIDLLRAHLESERLKLLKQRDTAQAAEKDISAEAAAAYKKVLEQRRALAQKEQEIGQLVSKKDRVLAQRDRTVSVRERQSLEKEAALLDEQIDQEESNGLSLLERIEQEELLWPEQKKEYDTKISALREEIAHYEATTRDLLARYIHLGEQRASVEKALEPDLRARYASLYERDRVPAVPVVENRCGGCHTILTMNELASLRRHVVVSCPECYKLLYSPV